MKSQGSDLEDRLIAITVNTPWFFEALLAVQRLGLSDWCIGAGAVRNLVWDALHKKEAPSHLPDVDVAYFDPGDISSERDRAIQRRLSLSYPRIPWEVTNQAGVHQWFESQFGHAVEPFKSLHEAVASWPEFTTAVAITIDETGAARVIAPFGLQDLFGMIVRRNPARVGIETYRQRVARKRYAERWPRVKVVPS